MAEVVPCSLPQRYVFVLMGFLALVIADGINFSSYRTLRNVYSKDNFTLDKLFLLNLYLSFYWGYATIQIPSGILVQRFGGKFLVGAGLTFSALVNFFVSQSLITLAGFLIVRIFIGMGIGIIQPGLNAMISQWTTKETRTSTASMVYLGSLPLNYILISNLSDFIVSSEKHLETDSCLYSFLGIIWFIFWLLYCYDKTPEHPYIPTKEQDNLETTESHPMVRMLTSTPLWALVIMHAGHEWGMYAMTVYLPGYIYMLESKHNGSSAVFIIEQQNEIFKDTSMWNYVAMSVCCLLMSLVADGLISSKTMSTTNVRRLGATISSVLPAILMILVAYSSHQCQAISILYILIMLFLGLAIPSLKVNTLDLSPEYSGMVIAVCNGAAVCVKIAVSYVWTMDSFCSGREKWLKFFWITFGAVMVANIFYFLLARGKAQNWNREKTDTTVNN